MNKWDLRFLQVARLVAGWSKDPSTGVGAVIVDELNRVVSLGFNGFPRGVTDDARAQDRAIKYEMTVHAEVNAILFAGRSLVGCTLYGWPLSPCGRCASIIAQSGISRVVSVVTANERWVESCGLGERVLREAGVGFRLYYPHEVEVA